MVLRLFHAAALARVVLLIHGFRSVGMITVASKLKRVGFASKTHGLHLGGIAQVIIETQKCSFLVVKLLVSGQGHMSTVASKIKSVGVAW